MRAVPFVSDTETTGEIWRHIQNANNVWIPLHEIVSFFFLFFKIQNIGQTIGSAKVEITTHIPGSEKLNRSIKTVSNKTTIIRSFHCAGNCTRQNLAEFHPLLDLKKDPLKLIEQRMYSWHAYDNLSDSVLERNSAIMNGRFLHSFAKPHPEVRTSPEHVLIGSRTSYRCSRETRRFRCLRESIL